MKIREILNINSVRITSGSTMATAAELAAMSNASGLFVVDDENNFIGVLSEGDMMAMVLPDISEIMASRGGIQDSHEIFTKKGAKLGREKVDDHLVIDLPPLTGSKCLVRETGHLGPRKKGTSRCPRSVFQSSRSLVTSVKRRFSWRKARRLARYAGISEYRNRVTIGGVGSMAA